MKELKFIIVLLFAGIIGCTPSITREEQLAIMFAQHSEWSEHHKDLIRKYTFGMGMTPVQVELAWNTNLTFEWESSSGYSYYSTNNISRCQDGRPYCTFRWSFCFYEDKLESWSKSPSSSY